MTFHMEVYGRPKFRVKLAWFFGLISKELTREKKKPEGEKETTKEKPKKKRRAGFGTVFEILRTRGLLGQIRILLRDIYSCFRISHLEANLRVGLDNPADTGLLFAFIGPATLFLRRSFPYQISIQPVFGEAILEGFSHGKVRLRPIQLVPSFMRFVFSLATIRVVKTLVMTKWKRKR